MKVARALRVLSPLAILALISGCDTPVTLLALGVQQAVSQHRWDDVNRMLRVSLSTESRQLLESRIDEFFLRKDEPGCNPFAVSPRVAFTVARIAIPSAAGRGMRLTQSLALLTAPEDAPEARVALSATVECAVVASSGGSCANGHSPVRYRRVAAGASSEAVFAVDGNLFGEISFGGRVPTEAQIRESVRRRELTHQLYPEIGCVPASGCSIVSFDIPASADRAAPLGATWLNASSTPELRARILPQTASP